MRIDIRTAALDDEVEQRVRIAVNLLAAYRLQARAAPWDGTRCHLLVAAADDAYGRQAIALASRRGTPVLALGTDGDGTPAAHVVPLSMASPATAIARAMNDRLRGREPEASGQPAAIGGMPGLCRLATAPMRGRAVDVDSHGRVAMLRPDVGRAYAASHSDLLAAADALGGGTGSLVVVERPPAITDGVSVSLEGLLLRAALRACEQLPPFPDGLYSLDAWPDLGALPDSVGVLTLSRRLTRGPASLADLCSGGVSGLDREETHACLWALAAADLLRGTRGETARSLAPPPRDGARDGLWRSLARRFGLAGAA